MRFRGLPMTRAACDECGVAPNAKRAWGVQPPPRNLTLLDFPDKLQESGLLKCKNLRQFVSRQGFRFRAPGLLLREWPSKASADNGCTGQNRCAGGWGRMTRAEYRPSAENGERIQQARSGVTGKAQRWD